MLWEDHAMIDAALVDAVHGDNYEVFAWTVNTETEMRRLIASSIGCALPADKNTYGYLSEHHAYGQTDEVAGDFAEDMAASMLASTLGVEFDENANWDEKEQVFKISGEIVRTFNVTQSAVIANKGWTTVVAAGVFIF